MNRPSILEMLSASIDRFRTRVALEWQDTRVSYEELEAKSDEVATRLMSSGAGKGTLVVVMLENSLHVIPALIGIWKAGCVFVPLDLNNPEKRLEAMLSLVKPEWAITEPGFVSLLERLLPATGRDLHWIQLVDGELQPAAKGERVAANGPATHGPDDLCYISFTSGSTGNPKAIAGRYKGIAHFVDWEIKTFGIDETCRLAQFTHYAFDAFLRDVFVPLCAGGTICIPDKREAIVEPATIVNWVDQRRISLIHCVPSLFRMMINQELRPEYFGNLKHIMLAGERLLPADVKKWMDLFGERVQLVNFYGPSETTMIKFFYPVQRADADRKSIPVGKPMEGARAIVVGADGKTCPPGSVGEIYIRTPYRSLGYYNAPELTREVFVPNPFNDDPQDLVYKTGDLGRVLSDGNFEFLGRKDHQVKIRGLRVELGEIENALRGYEGVREAVVIEATNTNGESYLCAYVAAGEELDTDQLREHLFKELPVNMVPATFIRLESLPHTLNGKVDRRALPPPEQKRARTPYVAPRTTTEETLAEIWRDLLGVERVGVNDDFFELGGHSLLATQLMSRLRTAFQVEVPLAALFENPTVARLAVPITQTQLAAVDSDDLSRLLDELEQSSDENAKSVVSGQV
ncbi:MAG TPA: non-ribosomal peptide synthetase [Pyrinomonadaceae bacterium]|nr:non-ribosomal peptide synthetase [Pyrinomonadaceae bacterium]